MALKFRGSSQIRDASVSLDKIAHVPSKTVLGRKLDSSGEMASLNASDFRDVAELSPSDDVEFNSMTANTVDATNSLVSLGSLDVNGVDSAGLTTLTQTLSANGAGNTLNDAEITSSMDALGTSTLNSGLVVSTNPLITDTMTVGNFGDVGNVATITGDMDLIDSAGILISETSMNVTGDLSVTSNFEFVGSGLEPELTSSNVNIDGGIIDAEIGSNVADSGKFSTLIASSLQVGGDLLQVSSDKTANLETDNLKISDPLLLLGKDNPADVLDLGLIFSYGVTPSSTYAIIDGSFDNGLTDWDTSVSGIGSSVSYNSNNGDVTLIGQNGKTLYPNVGSLLYQRVEFTPNAGKQYRFKFTVNQSFAHANSNLQLSYWDLDSTPVANQQGPILNKNFYKGSLPVGGVVESNLLDMSAEGLSGGFYIAIRTNVQVNIAMDYDSVKIDDVKLYEYDPVTQEEVEFVNPITAGFSGIIRDADQEDGINKFKLFDTQADLSDTSNVDFSNGNLGVLDSHIRGNIKFRDGISIGFDSSGDVTGSAMFHGFNDVAISTTINVDAVQYDDIDFLSLDSSLEGSSASDSKLSSEKAIKSYTDAQVASGGSDDDLEVRQIKMASEDDNGDISLVKVKEIIECIDCDSSNSDVSTEVITLSDNYDSEFMSMSKVFMNGQKLRYGAEYDYILQNDNELKIVSDILTFGDQFEVRYFIASDSGSSGSFGGGGAGSNESNTPTYPDPTDYGTEENDNVSVWESTPQDALANGNFETADNWTDYSYGDLNSYGEDFTFDTSWDEVNKRQKLCISNGFGPHARAITVQEIHYPFVQGETYKVKFNVFYDPNNIVSSAMIYPTIWSETQTITSTNAYSSYESERYDVDQLTVGQEVSVSFVADNNTVESIKVGAQLRQQQYFPSNSGHTGTCVSIDNFMITDANDVPLTRSIVMVASSASGNDGNLEEGSNNGLNISIQTIGWPAPAQIPFYFDTEMSDSDYVGTIPGVPGGTIINGSGKRVDGQGAWSGANMFLTNSMGQGTVNIYVADDVLCSPKSYELYIPHPEDGENTKLASMSGNITLSQEPANIAWRAANCGTPTYNGIHDTNVSPCPGDNDTVWLTGTNMTSGSNTGTYSINGGAPVTFNITEASSQFVANIMVGDSYTVTIPTYDAQGNFDENIVFSGYSSPSGNCP